MKIRNVKLLDGGRAGIEVQYVLENEKGGTTWNDKYKVEYRDPPPTELKAMFKELEEHLILICRITVTNDKKGIVKIDSISTDLLKFFSIGGTITTFDNAKINISTPKMPATTEYHGFDNVVTIAEKIFKAAYDHINSGKSSTYLEIGISLIGEKKAEEMSDEEITKFSKRHLQGKGAIVIENEDFTASDKDDEETDEETSVEDSVQAPVEGFDEPISTQVEVPPIPETIAVQNS